MSPNGLEPARRRAMARRGAGGAARSDSETPLARRRAATGWTRSELVPPAGRLGRLSPAGAPAPAGDSLGVGEAGSGRLAVAGVQAVASRRRPGRSPTRPFGLFCPSRLSRGRGRRLRRSILDTGQGNFLPYNAAIPALSTSSPPIKNVTVPSVVKARRAGTGRKVVPGPPDGGPGSVNPIRFPTRPRAGKAQVQQIFAAAPAGRAGLLESCPESCHGQERRQQQAPRRLGRTAFPRRCLGPLRPASSLPLLPILRRSLQF